MCLAVLFFFFNYVKLVLLLSLLGYFGESKSTAIPELHPQRVLHQLNQILVCGLLSPAQWTDWGMKHPSA